MSRIFEALQQFERERSSVELRGEVSAGQLLRMAEEHGRYACARSEDIAECDGAERCISEDSVARDRSAVAKLIDAIDDCEVPPAESLTAWSADGAPWAMPDGQDSCLVSLTAADSLAAEKFRHLTVRLQEIRTVRTLKTVLVTSTIPGEGKSTLAANLACTLAATGPGKTLLLDGDLRRPSIARIFGVTGDRGLTDCLQNEKFLKSSLAKVKEQNLWLLLGGRACKSPLELLEAGQLPGMMERLKNEFDWIIVDSAPVLPMADTNIWMRVADGIVLVTRPGITRLKQLKKGMEAITADKLIGTVVNCSRSVAHQSEYYYSYSAAGGK